MSVSVAIFVALTDSKPQPPAMKPILKDIKSIVALSSLLIGCASDCAGQSRALATLKGHTDQVWSVAFSQDGKRLASAGGSYRKPVGEVKVWDTTSGQEVIALKGHNAQALSVAFSRDGKRVAAARIPTCQQAKATICRLRCGTP